MGVIKGGVIVTGFIAPTDDTDVYATHDSVYGKGGFREVSTIAERDAITINRRREGMLVAVSGDTIYQLYGGIQNTNWAPLKTGSTGGTATSYTYEIAGSIFGKPRANDVVMRFVCASRIQFTVNLKDSQARCDVNATVPVEFQIQVNGGKIGTMTFSPTASDPRYATFLSLTTVLFPRDELTVVAPNFQDTTLENLEWTLVGQTI